MKGARGVTGTGVVVAVAVALALVGCAGGAGARPAATSDAKATANVTAVPSPPPPVVATDTSTFSAPEDTELEDAHLARGEIAVEILDGDGHGVGGVPLTLATYDPDTGAQRAVLAKMSADHDGRATLHVVPGAYFSLTATYAGGRFPAQFVVPANDGVRVRLHVYPSVTDPDASKTVFRVAVVLAPRAGDRVAVKEQYETYGLAPRALAADVTLALPPAAADFTAVAFPEAVHVERTARGARILDTVSPGGHKGGFEFVVPSHDGGVEVDLPLPPNTISIVVGTDAVDGATFEMADAPPAERRSLDDGRVALLLLRKFEHDGVVRTAHVVLRVPKR